MDSRNLRIVKELWRVYGEDGHDAGMEALLAQAHDDAEFRFYAGEEQVFRSADELRAFYRRQRAEGTTIRATPYDFEEEGSEVRVSGSVRVMRAGGSLVDAQVRWTYCFRDGKLESVEYSPLAAPATA